MKYLVLDTYDDLSRNAADIFMEQLRGNKSLLLGASTGSTPTGLYSRLGDCARKDPSLFSALRVIKLDEWHGLPMNDPGTCESYLRTRVLEPLKIGADRYFAFNGETKEPEAECAVIRNMLDRQGPIDVCILGLGMNGHIAFNEPAAALVAHAHLSVLARSSQFHPMVADRGVKPVAGLTLGMADIFQSRLILLLISGAAKRDVTQELLSQKITTALPASLLWLHSNAICLMDRDAYPL
ncbi:MAG TPA: galactosamine-6-phosphate isomerase [Puia sp.]|jgi:galactosamine-6-phosphate isomerase|nr:galactosamine-6-phosphate isomerase [Puia sp.]